VVAFLLAARGLGWSAPGKITDDYQLRVWGTEEGLRSSSLTRVIEARDEYLWVGSYSEFTRFDGLNFAAESRPELGDFLNEGALSLDLGPTGSLWLSNQSGVAVRRRGVWRRFATGGKWNRATVRSVVEMPNGEVYAGLSERLCRLTETGLVEIPLPMPTNSAGMPSMPTNAAGIALPPFGPGNEITCVLDKKANLWLKTKATVARFDRGQITPIPRLFGPGGHIEWTVLGCAAAQNGGLWLAGSTNIWLYDDGAWSAKPLQRPLGFENDSVTLFEDSRSNLWAGSYTRGLLRYSPDGRVAKCTTEDGLENNSILSITEDREGNIWVASNGGGLVRLQPRTFSVFTEKAGLSQSVVNTILQESPTRFLVGTHGSSVVRFDGTKFAALAPEQGGTMSDYEWVFSLATNRVGTLWAGVYGDGLIKVEGKYATRIDPRLLGGKERQILTVNALYMDSNERLWIGSSESVASLYTNEFTVYGAKDGLPKHQPGKPTVNGIVQDRSGTLYFAGDEAGLLRWTGERFERVRAGGRELAPADAPMCGRDGSVWLAGGSNTVLRVRGEDLFVYTPEMGQLLRRIHTIVEDDSGDLWLGAENGIERISLASLDAVAAGRTNLLDVRLLDRTDGLRSTQVRGGGEGWPSGARGSDGRLWFCTLKGLAVIDPESAPILHRRTEVSVEWFRADGIDVLAAQRGRQGGIVLPPGTKRIEIKYTTPVLSKPERARFEHYVQSIDTTWVDDGNKRVAEFQDLRPGEYIFHVRGGDVDRSWQGSEAILPFIVMPFYYQTALFRFSAAAGAAGVIGLIGWGIASWRFRRGQEMAQAAALRAAMDAADSANQAKSVFLASMSHEIRTPMNGVVGFTDLLMETRLDAQQKQFVNTIRHSADLLLSIINDILDFSKIEAGKLTIDHTSFNPREVAAEVVDLMGARAAEKNLTLILRLVPGLPRRVMGDAGRLRQVLLNLVSNAVKFTERGYVCLQAETTKADTARREQTIEFTVTDTGIGIPEDVKPRLFERFSQADSTTTRKYGGSGLGLAISKRLVELMGGRVAFRSVEGAGSTFWVTVPFEAPPDAIEPPAPEAIRGSRLLVADHDRPSLEAIIDLLQTPDVEVVGASGAQEAVRTAREAAAAGRPFKFALIEEGLPDLKATTLLARPQIDPALAQITCLAVSSRRGKTPPADAIGVLTKPLTRAALVFQRLAEASVAASALPVEATPSSNGSPSEAAHQVPAAPFESKAAGGAQPVKPPKCRVLLAEDNEINQVMALAMLSRHPCDVDVAANGVAAVKLCEANDYRLILMDCQMPEMDGLDATAEIRRRHPGGPAPVIIAVTANALAGEREKCLAAGMDDYLSKPFRASELDNMLKKWSILS
jgi:signal transduction histidine kinase/CheY-like chemotaxis protein/ligand-binding sensor domain-containing protein